MNFHVLGLINPTLRTPFLLQEFLQQREKNVQVRIGTAIPSELISSLDSDVEATKYLRLRTYLLSYRGKKTSSLPSKVRTALPRKRREEIAPEALAQFVIRDIAALPAERVLVENSEFAVYAARANELPNALEELGRLRRITASPGGSSRLAVGCA